MLPVFFLARFGFHLFPRSSHCLSLRFRKSVFRTYVFISLTVCPCDSQLSSLKRMMTDEPFPVFRVCV